METLRQTRGAIDIITVEIFKLIGNGDNADVVTAVTMLPLEAMVPSTAAKRIVTMAVFVIRPTSEAIAAAVT